MSQKETGRVQSGETYGSVDWVTGGVGFYTFTGTALATLTLKEAHDEIDGFHTWKGTSDYVIHEEDGREYIVMGSYLGCEDRIYAGE